MKKNQTVSQKAFKLKEETAIDVINSMYSYDQVKFFVELVPELISKNDCSNLNQKDLQNLGQLVKAMADLIDSAEVTALLEKFSHIRSVRPELDVTLKDSVNITSRSAILSDEMLTWLNNVPLERRRKLHPIADMNDFFVSGFFFCEFIKWLDFGVLKESITLIELLDGYYSWFPFTPRQF